MNLVVVPRQVKNPDTMTLCHLIGISREEFINRMQKARNFSTLPAFDLRSPDTREITDTLKRSFFSCPVFNVQPRTCGNTHTGGGPLPLVI